MAQNKLFDYVHDSQETFRLMLHAISSPGKIISLEKQINKLNTSYSHLLVVALTLLDKETSFLVADDEEFEKLLCQVTYANQQDAMAAYVFVSQQCSVGKISEILANSNPGTMTDPHTSTTLIVSTDATNTATDDKPVAVTLTGPGIRDSKTIEISEYIKQWIIQRDTENYEYPLGIDLFFVSKNGDLFAIPRKVKMKG